MNRLRIEDVSGYLNHELKGLVMYDIGKEICILGKSNSKTHSDLVDFCEGTYVVKPILKPLSELVIPERFKEVVCKNGYGVTTIKSLEDLVVTGNINDAKEFLEFLYEEHYDVNGLLRKDLALTQNQASVLLHEDALMLNEE